MTKKWTRTSASQHEAFKRCQRYWYYGWIEKVPRDTTPAMQRGTDIHAEIEHYLKTGSIRDSSYTDKGLNYRPYVQSLVPKLPPPGHPELLIEQKINLKTPYGVWWLGFIDIAFAGQSPVLIRDTKTTSDFRYAKTPAELMENIQLNSYAKWVYAATGYQGEIDLGHLYVKTENKIVRKSPKVKEVSVVVDRDHVFDLWDREMEVVKEMKTIAATVEDAHDLPPTVSACGMYGGCPFGNRCGISMTDLFQSGKAKTKETQKMANKFLAGLKGKKVVEKKEEAKILPDDAPPRETAPTPPEEVAAASGDEEPEEKPKTKKRGRPKGSTSKKTTAPAKVKNGGFTIYVDCMPVKDVGNEIEPTLFADWFGPIVEEMNDHVQKEKNIPSYMLLPFAERKAMVAIAIKDRVDRGMLPPSMVIHAPALDSKDVLDMLTPHATALVMGRTVL